MRCFREVKSSMTMAVTLGVLGLSAIPQMANAQATVKIDINSKNVAPTVTLSDGTTVLLMESINSTNALPKYRYLPLTPRLVKKPDGTPVFLFASYNKSKRLNDTGVDQVGAILNFSMTYGLDKPLEDELAQKIRNQDKAKGSVFMPNASLDGPILVKPESANDSFFITSATLGSEDLTRKVITTGKAPLFPGSQVATAARLTSDGAQIFEQTLKKGKGAADLAVSFNLAFDAMMPAIKATITIDWGRLHNNVDTYSSEFKDRLTSVDGNAKINYWKLIKFPVTANVKVDNQRVSKEEVKAFYDYLIEKSVIKFELQQYVSNPTDVEQKILDSFFATFMEMISKKENPPDPSASRQSLTPPDMSHLEKLPKTGAKAADSGFFGGLNVAVKKDNTEYKVRQYTINNISQKTKQVIRLDIAKSYKYPVQITGNIAQFYDQAKDNPKCVMRFYLDDPFFQKIDIPISCSTTPTEFLDYANALTVSIRKKRGVGQPDFYDSKTFTSADIKNNSDASLETKFSYAGGDDATVSRQFEYKYQWALKNGKVWPAQAIFKSAPIESVSIIAPYMTKVLDVVSSSDSFQTNDIVRTTAQVRYLQLGAETETTVLITKDKADTGISQTIYVDRDTSAYIYRIIFITKNGKKYSTEWMSSSDSIIAIPPDDLLTNSVYLSRPDKPLGQTKDLIVAASKAAGN